jgi:hypothetical protein
MGDRQIHHVSISIYVLSSIFKRKMKFRSVAIG